MKNIFANRLKFHCEILPAEKIFTLTMLVLLFPLLSISQRTFNTSGTIPAYAAPVSVAPVFSNVWRTQIISGGKGSNAAAKSIDTLRPVPDVPILPNVTGECSATVTAAPTATIYGGEVVIGTTSDPLSYSAQGSYIIHWKYDNGSGHPSFQDQNVIVQDISAPAPDIETLPDVTGECSASVILPTATDNCAGVISAITSDPLTYTAQGTYFIHWTFEDGNGNTSSQDQNVIVQDVTAAMPDLANLPDVTAECAANVEAVPTATDNCAGVISATTSEPLSYTTQGTYIIHWTFEDGNGNTSTQVQNVIIKDISAPVPDVANLPVVSNEISVTVTTAPTATDNCSGAVTATTSDPLTYTAQGTYLIHWTYNDGNGNTSLQDQNVIVKDVTAPVPFISNLPAITGECSATASATPPSAFDNVEGVVTATTSDPLTYTAQGTYTIHWTYNDGNGNTSSQDQNVIVKDISSPAADMASLPVVTGESSVTLIRPTATDNCAGVVTATTPDPLTYSIQGSYLIHWTYDDGNGNTSTQDQNVIVKDVSAPVPVVAYLPDVTGECSATATPPSAIDNIAGGVTASTPDPLSYTAQGTYIIHWTYNDGNGNTSSQDQNVIVKDISSPAADMASLPVVTGESSVAVTAPTATDNCAGVVTATTPDPLTYSIQGSYLIHWTYDDGNGNTSLQGQNVIVKDVSAPVPVVVNLPNVNGECSATATAPSAMDNVAGIVTAITSDSLAYTAQGTYTIHWTYNDGNGNTSSQNQNVIVKDVSAPTFTALLNVVSCDGIVESIAPQNVSDNCSSTITITYELSGATVATGVNNASHELFNPGTTVVKYTLTDENENSSQFSFNVENSEIDVDLTVNQNVLTANETGTYQWFDCTNQIQISNETSQSFTALNNGVYSVIVSQNGCLDTSACIDISVTGTQEYLNNDLANVSVFPNPTNGILNITSGIENAGLNFNIVDVNGKEVFARSEINNKLNLIDIEKLSQGIYFMKISGKEEQRIIKIVKQ